MQSPAKRQRLAATSVQHSSSIKVPGLVVTNHVIPVPLDYSGKVPGQLQILVREVSSPAASKGQPYLLYLQGGPGFGSPCPTEASGWIKSAVANFRVVLMDQRGTGQSCPITTRNLGKHRTPKQQAEYLSFFRADSIVRDAEVVREALVPKDNCMGKWSILGQSFGGFCSLTYLGMAPEGLTEVLLTGGIPPNIHQGLGCEAAYRSLYRRLIAANHKFYARFPEDVALVQRIVSYLASQPEGGLRLPSGTLLTPRAFQTLGLSGLGSGGGFERLHYLLESFFDGDDDVNPAFIKAFESWQVWDSNPLYALLQETIYTQGQASRWCAHRVREEPELQSQYDPLVAVQQGKPVLFTGEQVFPWHFDDFAALRPFKATAELLHSKQDWAPLYDMGQLGQNTVPVVAATYLEDMYVDYEAAQESASRVRGLRQWVTNEYRHSGIRDDGGRILERLVALARDVIFD